MSTQAILAKGLRDQLGGGHAEIHASVIQHLEYVNTKPVRSRDGKAADTEALTSSGSEPFNTVGMKRII